MAILAALSDVEAWLSVDADSWRTFSHREYMALVRQWSESFSPLVAANAFSLKGHQSMLSLENRLPADVLIFSGIRVPELANMGGYGPAAYQANRLRCLRRDLANRNELIMASADFTWSCIFSHEAWACVWEHLYERGRSGCAGREIDRTGRSTIRRVPLAACPPVSAPMADEPTSRSGRTAS